MIKRIIGLILILTGLLGLALSYFGVRSGHQLVDDTIIVVDQQLALAGESLDATQEALILTRISVSDLGDGIGTLEQTATDLARTLRETQPMLDQTTQLISHDLPDSIEALQTTMPDVIQVAAAVDTTLTTLNRFQIDEEILGYRFQYDLGIQYEPAIPFDESIAQISSSLDPLPPRLRSMEIYAGVTEDNIDRMNQDLLAIATDLEKIKKDVEDSEPVINNYIALIQEESGHIQDARDNLPTQGEGVKQAINWSLLWLALMQIVPLYLGWELLLGNRTATTTAVAATESQMQSENNHDISAAPDENSEPAHFESDTTPTSEPFEAEENG